MTASHPELLQAPGSDSQEAVVSVVSPAAIRLGQQGEPGDGVAAGADHPGDDQPPEDGEGGAGEAVGEAEKDGLPVGGPPVGGGGGWHLAMTRGRLHREVPR